MSGCSDKSVCPRQVRPSTKTAAYAIVARKLTSIRNVEIRRYEIHLEPREWRDKPPGDPPDGVPGLHRARNSRLIADRIDLWHILPVATGHLSTLSRYHGGRAALTPFCLRHELLGNPLRIREATA